MLSKEIAKLLILIIFEATMHVGSAKRITTNRHYDVISYYLRERG